MGSGIGRLVIGSLLAIAAALGGSVQAGEGEIVFASYNLENYFQAADFPNGGERISKPPENIAAEIHVIQDIHPDILGVCEMGPPNEFRDFQARLKEAGLSTTRIPSTWRAPTRSGTWPC